jgi:hypothetical protein
MTQNENFYIYRYIRLDTNTPFYVGKGKGDRAYALSRRNKRFLRIIAKVGYKVQILLSNLSEDLAFKKEIEFIKLYKSIGYCEANFTNGGEGSSGRIVSQITKEKISKSKMNHLVSEETKIKMSKALSGPNNPFYGKFGEEHPSFGKIGVIRKPKKYISKRIKVLCLNNNTIYSSITEASLVLNLDLSSILKVAKGSWKHTKGYKFLII